MALGFLDKMQPKKGTQEFVNTIVQGCLDYVCRRVSQKKRDQWTGQTKSEDIRGCTNITITLTHKCGVEVVGRLSVSKKDFATRSETAAAQKGVGLAKELIRKIQEHERRCDYDAHKEYVIPGRTVNVRARGNFPEPNAHNEQVKKELAKADVEKARKKRMECPICGDMDDKTYPPWGECEHVREHEKASGTESVEDKRAATRKSRTKKANRRGSGTVQQAKDRAAKRQSPVAGAGRTKSHLRNNGRNFA